VKRAKILALDYGTKNVGLACSDELAVTVRPLPSLPNQSRQRLLIRLRSAIQENAINELVVGIPWNLNGTPGEAVRQVEKFINDLRAELGLPVHSVDERLSTVEALETWNTMSARQQRRYRTVDSLAAAFILERFLEES
jgi:putative Holliday junction resolvase